MDWQQRVIADTYQGDAKSFAAAYAEAVEEGRKGSVQWDDLLRETVTLPNLKDDARLLIEAYLGYLPADSVIMPYEPFLRALSQSHAQGHLSDDQFMQEAEAHIKLIRKADLQHNTCLDYDAAIYENYRKHFVPYGQIVKDRLTQFLGYEPELQHSLIAELWLREVMADDRFMLPNTVTPADWKAVTLIKYREILLEGGLEAADASSLLCIVADT